MTWLILIHQIPAKPTYFRAKIWRRLQQLGAIPIKQAVYTMPKTDQSLEDLGWIAKEIIDQGGEAIILDACLLEGLSDKQVTHLFQKTRRTDYEKILEDARSLMSLYYSQQVSDSFLSDCKASLRRLKKSFKATVNIDFFPGPEQGQVASYLDDVESTLDQFSETTVTPVWKNKKIYGYTWVTRSNVFVDRMASAWFIKRFIDQNVLFKFVEENNYQPGKDELRFDMHEAEYTHQNDMCTFEVLVQTFCPQNSGLVQIAKLVHDIDLKDDSYGLPETAGIQMVLESIVATNQDDLKRIQLASIIFDGLLTSYSN